MLKGGSGLESMVGQKVQVTGRAAAAPDASAPSATASTGATATAGTSGTTATAGTTGTTGTAGTATAGEPKTSAAPAQLQLDVQSVKMVAASCQ
jgi:hypothetical protein